MAFRRRLTVKGLPRRGRKNRGKAQQSAVSNDTLVLSPVVTTNNVTAASNLLNGSVFVDCRNSGSVIGSYAAGIANYYAEYRYKHVAATWLPLVGPGVSAAGGRIYVAYIDNPELINAWLGFTAANALSAIKNVKNVKTYNVWEKFTYSVPLTHRRPWFDVNYNITDGVDVDDRSVQGQFIFAAETVGATDTIGSFQINSRVTLRGYTPSINT